MQVFPSLRQWRGWSLPSKFTYIGTVAGLISLLVTAGAVIPRTNSEVLYIESSRVNEDYPTTFERPYCDRCAISQPAFVEALWDVTLANNGSRDLSVIQYEVEPLGAPYGQYQRGLANCSDGLPMRLPIIIAAGHAVCARVRSWLVLPGEVAFELAAKFGALPNQLPTLGYLFDKLYSLGIDCFENQVTAGPRGYDLADATAQDLRDQRLRVSVRTSRNRVFTSELTWYGISDDRSSSGERLAWPLRPISIR
jgi:hypothetical protein